MIDVSRVLAALPRLERFCSVAKLHSLVAELRADARFEVTLAGHSAGGRPIHHLRFGTGSLKALIVAGPHAPEQIGSLTVFGLMTLLREGQADLTDLDVEWHIVPCIDPDGALLNEGWSQRPFSLETFMTHFYQQAFRDQVDGSFPISYKKLTFEHPSVEAQVLRSLLDQVMPDFYFSLHNTFAGGAMYYLTQDLGSACYTRLYELLRALNYPIQSRPVHSPFSRTFGVGVVESFSIRKFYDHLEATGAHPQAALANVGAGSYEYLADVKPVAVTFVAEPGYVLHPWDGSSSNTPHHLRKLKLRVDADTKFVATAVVEAYEAVKDELDPSSPFYRAMIEGYLTTRERIASGGLPLTAESTLGILGNPAYDKLATEGECFAALMRDGGFPALHLSYQFVRLLKASRNTPPVRQAIASLERVFDEALGEIKARIDFAAFNVVDCNVLSQVQLGSGLIALDTLLER